MVGRGWYLGNSWPWRTIYPPAIIGVSLQLPQSPDVDNDIVRSLTEEYLALSSQFLGEKAPTFEFNDKQLQGQPVARYSVDGVTVMTRVRPQRDSSARIGSDRTILATRLVNGTVMANLPGWSECCLLGAIRDAFEGRAGDEFGIIKVGSQPRPLGVLTAEIDCTMFAECPSEWEALEIFINVDNHQCQFGSLSKSALVSFAPSNGGEPLAILTAALRGCLRRIKRKWPEVLPSVADWNAKCAMDIWAPKLCEIIGRVSRRSVDVPGVQKGLVDLLERTRRTRGSHRTAVEVSGESSVHEDNV